MSRPSFRGASEMEPKRADLHREQQVGRAINESLPTWLRDGRLVPVSLTNASQTKATHGLGRALQGWFMGSCSGDASLVNVIMAASDASTITLENRGASGTLNLVLWVY